MRAAAARASGLAVVCCALAACGGSGDGGDAGGAGDGAGAASELIVELTELNGSGQTGTATLTASADGTMVTVETVSYFVDPQPVSLREGTCAEPGGLAHELATIEDGISVTTVAAPLGDLRAAAYAIVVAKSRKQPDAPVACGQLG